MIVIIFIIFLKLYRLFSLKPFKHKICFPLKPEIYFPYRVSILVHFRFFTFQEVNLLSSGNRVSVSVEPCKGRQQACKGGIVPANTDKILKT